MRIASRTLSAGSVIRFEVDYCEWLERGRTLVTGTAASEDAPADITINQVSVTSNKLFFFAGGGTVNETFTVTVQVTDTIGESVTDTISFRVTE